MRRVRAIEKYRNEKSLKEDFKYLKTILQMRTRPSYPLTFKSYTPHVADGNKKSTTPIEEWNLIGTSFDGLWPMECILVEAKGQYAKFLDPKKPRFLKLDVFNKLVLEARRQKTVVNPYKTTKLTWYFYEKEAKTFFDSNGGLVVTSIHMPL